MPLPMTIGSGLALLAGDVFRGPQSIPGLAAWYDAMDMDTLFVHSSASAITDVTNSGGLIKITSGAIVSNGNRVRIAGVVGVPADGWWIVSNQGLGDFTLAGSTFSGSYVSGGTAQRGVLSDGDVVGNWWDKSGWLRHLVQATGAKQPVWSSYALLISPTLLNGGFETLGGGGADVFGSWAETVNGTSTIASDAGYNGTYSCKFTEDGAGSSAYIQQTVLTVGRTYRWGLWAKGTNAGDTLFVFDPSVGDVGTITLTTSWAYYTGTFTAVGTVFRIITNGLTSHSAWIDDVVLERLPGVVFDGTDDCFTLTPDASWTAQNWTFFEVVAFAFDAARYRFDSEFGRLVIGSSAANKTGYYDAGFSWKELTAPTAGLQQQSLVLNTAGAEGFRDGASIGTGAYTATAIAGGTVVGSNYTAGSQFMKGQYSEFFFYKGALSAASRGLIENYLRNKWRTP